MTEIFIRTKGVDYGPYDEGEFQGHLKAGRIPFSAWVYRQDRGWELLAESSELRHLHPDYEPRPSQAAIKGKTQTNLPDSPRPVTMPSADTTLTISAEPVWFFIREKKKFGPYSAAELIGQLQKKQLDAGTFVWRPGFDTWQRMSTISEFNREAMRKLASQSVPVDILVKRRYTRAPYEVEVIAHDDTHAIEGKTMVIGEGGLFLATKRPSHKIGARLKLHFREGAAPPFNAIAEVVSIVRGEMPGYCMRFVAISDTDRRKISKFVSEQK